MDDSKASNNLKADMGTKKNKATADWLFFTIRLPASLAPKITMLTEAEQKRDAMRKGTASGALARFVTEQLEQI